VGSVDNGWAVTHTTMSNERALIGGGGGQITVEGLVDFARRVGRSKDPLIRQQIAAFYTRSELLRFMNYRVQTAISHGRMPGPEASTTKLFISQHASLTGELVMELSGAAGMLADGCAIDDGVWERTFLNQWMIKLGGGTDNIQRNALAEGVLGLPREARTDKDVPFSQLA
jgi:alkylation response protein AidB-like acyl-CoA dehydrogenase